MRLNYAPEDKSARASRLRRVILRRALMLIAAGIVIYVGIQAVGLAQIWICQRRCLALSDFINGRVMFSQGAAPQAAGAPVDRISLGRSSPPVQGLKTRTAAWESLCKLNHSNAGDDPLLFIYTYEIEGRPSMAVISLCGEEMTNRLEFHQMVFDGSPLVGLAHSSQYDISIGVPITPNSVVFFYGGKMDDKDPNHFTIRVQIDGKDVIVHGRLMHDGTIAMCAVPDGIRR